jgi:hypothetical protein
MENRPRVIGREHVGIFDLLTFDDQTTGIAWDGRIVYFQDREGALDYALKIKARNLWAQALINGTGFGEYDVGRCQITVYADDVVGVCHAGDERTFMVNKFFETRALAEDYAREVNQARFN